MNTFTAARHARPQPVDLLFSGRSQHSDDTNITSLPEGRMAGFDISKLSIDLNNTQRQSPYVFRGNESLFNVNLLQRILKSGAALWRNPVRTIVRHWGRREVMHVFNGLFHQSITDYERYETFGRCYTCPDPFRNDDPPWTPSFC